MTVIIIFGLALLGALGYVLWFAITNGLWNSILSNTSILENDIKSMITQAENNANALGGIISREFQTIENALIGTYQTVSTTLVNTSNKVRDEGKNIIDQITIGGDDAINKVKNTFDIIKATFTNLGDQITGASKTAIDQIEATAKDSIGKVNDAGKSAITQIKNAFATVQSTLIDTSKTISTESQAIIDKMKTDTIAAYDIVSKGTTDTFNKIDTACKDAVAKIQSGGAQAVNSVTTITNTIKTETDKVIGTIKTETDKVTNTVANEALSVIAKIKDGSVKLGQQIANEATAAANTIAAGATSAANTVAAGATSGANTVGATGATITNRIGAGALGFQDYREGFESPAPDPVPVEQSLFFNLQPLAIKDTGFLGPYPRGSYKEDIATANVLKAGCRFLTLQIDYTDLKMDLSLFEVPGVPTLLIRGPDGKLMSKNSGSIQTVAETIANIAFNPIVPHSRLPVILYLHVVRAPNALNSPDAYLDFLSQIADALNPIAPFHLGLHPQGNFTRQKMAEELLTMPMSTLDGQVIILSNADTSMFRRSTISKNKYPPAKDLDFWVNMRVYLDTPDDLNGITPVADPDVQPTAVLVSLKRILSLSSVNMDAFAARSKRRYVIAMGDRLVNPTPAQVNIALNKLGVNIIPIDIFTDIDRDVLLLSNEYSNKSFRQKPVNLQYSA